ncbi:MAG: hypothetical protein HYZ75_09340 [Elusimicrobia bacterium]|nr:hypothetical protein [Elusimicrobiota bacterium]
MALDTELRSTPEGATRWDWWPLARLLTTGAVLGLAAHHYLEWTPDLRHLARLPREVFEVLSFFSVISFALAHLYVMLLMFPLYAVVTLNDTFYDLSAFILRAAFRLSGPGLAVAGLAGEILLFGAVGGLLGRLVRIL